MVASARAVGTRDTASWPAVSRHGITVGHKFLPSSEDSNCAARRAFACQSEAPRHSRRNCEDPRAGRRVCRGDPEQPVGLGMRARAAPRLQKSAAGGSVISILLPMRDIASFHGCWGAVVARRARHAHRTAMTRPPNSSNGLPDDSAPRSVRANDDERARALPGDEQDPTAIEHPDARRDGSTAAA